MIERSEVNQMTKFMAAIKADALTGPDDSDHSTITRGGNVSDNAVAEMKLVLERFHAATDHLMTEASSDRELREALLTEATEQGARIGSWEIRVKQTGKHKLYDVVNAVNGEPLAVDLLLYEAARGLVRILTEGGRINSANAIELLRAEQDYGSRVHDMVLYRHRLATSVNNTRTPVFEARYSDARSRAVVARERVRQLAEGTSYRS